MFRPAHAAQERPVFVGEFEKSRIERVIISASAVQSRHRSRGDMDALMQETLHSLDRVSQSLEVLLALSERLSCTRTLKARHDLLDQFDRICDLIDGCVQPVNEEYSLIDGGTFSLVVPIGIYRNSKIVLPHFNLTTGASGLGLRAASASMREGQPPVQTVALIQQAFRAIENFGAMCRSTRKWLLAG